MVKTPGIHSGIGGAGSLPKDRSDSGNGGPGSGRGYDPRGGEGGPANGKPASGEHKAP